MSKIVKEAEAQLYQRILDAMGRCVSSGILPAEPAPAFHIEVPADSSHGDYAANTAMACARAFKMAPVKIAKAIAGEIDLSGTYFKKAEIAGPGFLNFFLNQSFFAAVLQDIKECGENYGRSDYGQGKKVMV